MKKLAVVLAALLLACVFVGCGAIGKKAFLSEWNVVWSYGTETWTFNDDDTFTWKDPWTVNDPSVGKWVYDGVNVTISDFKKSYDGVWAVEFVSADEMKWTIVSYTYPDFVPDEKTGETNADKQAKGENFTFKKVTADAE